MIERLEFIQALAAAIPAIITDSWPAWSAAHAGDPFFRMIEERLLCLRDRHGQPDLETLCAYLVAEDLVPAPQSVPSAMFWPYKRSATFADSRGVIKKRVPASIVKSTSGALNGAPGSWRWGAWEIFKKAIECLRKQPPTGGAATKDQGPMGRDKWFAEAAGSGLFWLCYFMRYTLNFMYGPGAPNKWPFSFRMPPWCVTSHRRWRLNAYDDDGYAWLNLVWYPPAGKNYGSGISLYIKISPDTSKPNPGNMDVGSIFSEHASMNDDWEVEGDYETATLSPLPSSWIRWPISCSPHSGDNNLYQLLHFQNMSGAYIIDVFVSSNFSVNEPEYLYVEKIGGLWY